jgi:predicted aspartyl protease
MAVVLVAASLSGLAQQGPTQSPAPKTNVGPSVKLPQTPASSGPDAYVKNFDYAQLAAAVDAMPPSLDRDYFSGVLANRAGRVAESIELLRTVLPHLESAQHGRAAIALQSLADDYIKSYRYNDAIQAYEELLHKYASQLDKVERQSSEDDYHAALLLKDAPPQTVSGAAKVDLPTHRNPALDSIETTLTVNGVQQSWILDTGANFSTVSTSFAAKLGVKLSRDVAQTQGATGAENKLRVALLPEVRLGGATLRNVVLLVLDDNSLNVATGKSTHYQIDAILGYPVLQALQRITFTKDGHFLAGPDSPSGQGGAKLYMYELTPLLECEVENRKVLFSFDTGANGSVLSDRYYRDFPDQFKRLKKKPHEMSGAGGVKKTTAYYVPEVRLAVGQTHAVLHDVPVASAMGTDMDRFYGTLGRDLVDPYRSFTMDFESMRFLLADQPATQSK